MTIFLLLVIIGLLLERRIRRFAKSLRVSGKSQAELAVRNAAEYVGIPMEQYGPDFNLLQAGKLSDVLVRAARELDHDHKFETVQDVVDVLSK